MSTRSFSAKVRDAGGGIVDLLVDRDTEFYPPAGMEVKVSWEHPRFGFSTASDNEWLVRDRDLGGAIVARFYGTDARAFAQDHAEHLNEVTP